MDWEQLKPIAQAWVVAHENELVSFVKELVSYPSVGAVPLKGSEHPFGQACAHLANATQAMVERYGLTWENHSYYAISAKYAQLSLGACERPRMAFYSHLDVVPASEEGWRKPPFEPYVQDGWIFGRGSTDNKGPFASVLFALRFLQEHDVRLNHDVVLFGGFDEETNMEDVKWLVEHEPLPQINLVSDCPFPVCVAEKGILQITVVKRLDDPALVSLEACEAHNVVPAHAWAQVGKSQERDSMLDHAHQGTCGNACGDGAAWDMRDVQGCERSARKASKVEGVSVSVSQQGSLYKATGVSAHAGFPEGSVNAFVLLAQALGQDDSLHMQTRAAFQSLAKAVDEYDGSGLGVALHDDFLGDTTVVPVAAAYEQGKLRVTLNVRYPGVVGEDWMVGRLSGAFEGLGYEFFLDSASAARVCDPNDERVDLLTNLVNEELGTSLEPYAMGGATHARWIPGALGFGPGSQRDQVLPAGVGSGHEVNEAVNIEHLKQAILIYLRAILALDKQ